jgi:hypothetical protein
VMTHTHLPQPERTKDCLGGTHLVEGVDRDRPSPACPTSAAPSPANGGGSRPW